MTGAFKMAAFVCTSHVLLSYLKFILLEIFREFNFHGQLDQRNILTLSFSHFTVVCLASMKCVVDPRFNSLSFSCSLM